MTTAVRSSSHNPFRLGILRLYARLIGYRYFTSLPNEENHFKLEVPPYIKAPSIDQVREKSRASLTTVGVVFGFNFAVMAALMVADYVRNELLPLNGIFSFPLFLVAMFAIILPCLIVWFERYIGAANDGKTESTSKIDAVSGKRRQRTIGLCIALPLSIVLFFATLGIPFVPVSRFPENDLSRTLVLAGFVLLIISAFLLLIGLEFYDSASGWRAKKGVGDEKEAITGCETDNQNAELALTFHLAGLASHSTLFGTCLTLAGVSLTLCLIKLILGVIAISASLIVIVAMPEMERALWDAQ